jgi:quercetin dioxygenase-like cupin family protein
MALHHVKSGEAVDLSPLGNALQTTKTKALVKTDAFEACHLIVLAGKEIPPHDVPGNITLHCLEGRVQLVLEKSTIELAPGQWIYLDGGEKHAVVGVEDSSLLLTILFDR